jgi:hypothetical protein
MGIKRIDFGSVEVKERGSFKPLADGSKVKAIVKSFKFDHASTGTPFIEVKFEIDDEDAVDVDGGRDFGSVWDKIYFSEKSVKMAKLKLKGLSVDVNNLVIESEDDLRDLVEELRESQVDSEVILVTEIHEWNEKLSTRVKFINVVEK